MQQNIHACVAHLIIVTALVLISACSGFTSRGTPPVPQIHVGTQGIVANFVGNTPPAQVLEEGKFDMLLELHNQGATDVDDALLSISTNPEYLDISIPQGQSQLRLAGKSLNNPRGDKTLLSLKGFAGRVSQKTPVSVPITTSICYPYATEAAPVVCIDTDPEGLKQQRKACTAQAVSLGGSQGAPVAVTRIEVSSLPHDDPERVIPNFKIFIGNVGNGEVIDAQQVDSYCQGRPDKDAFNIVSLKARLQESFLLCDKQILKLKSQDAEENYVQCELPQGIERRIAAFSAPITIILDYGYAFSVTRQINVVPRERS
ncbi:hypothetical protein HY641_02525 [Candidatus Woesearchaeota archaeon]|nr:hypothetical protein [Candidatus Woesearchaeota archaeon]